jgi:hypothetical protein
MAAMAQSSLRLVVDVDAPDQTLIAGSFGSSLPLRHSDFLAHGLDPATGKKGTYVHANIVAKVMQGGADVSKQHRLWRRLRYWDIRNSNPGTFGGLNKATDCAKDWFDDNQGGGGFSDTPGTPAFSGPGMSGFQMLYEFVVFIDRHQAATTGAYFFLIFSVDRSSYEVIRSSVLPVSFGQWPAIEVSPKPWMIGKGMATRTSNQLPRP